jgi:hypothetical protein
MPYVYSQAHMATFPKFVQCGFFFSITQWASLIDQVVHLSLVNCNCLIPQSPHEARFFPILRLAPNVYPF